MRPFWQAALVIFGSFLLSGSMAPTATAQTSDIYYDEANNCIINAPFNQQWELPVASGWKDLATTVMTIRPQPSGVADPANAFVSGFVGLGESNTAGTEVEYRILANGASIGQVTKAVPLHFPHTQTITALGENLQNAAGSGVTFRFQARNLGTCIGSVEKRLHPLQTTEPQGALNEQAQTPKLHPRREGRHPETPSR